jgi:hypothetical protein
MRKPPASIFRVMVAGDGGSRFLQNISTYLPMYRITSLKRVIFSDNECLLWEDTSFSKEVTCIKADDPWVQYQVQYTDMWHSRNEHRNILVGKIGGKRPLHRSRNRWEGNINMYL